MIRFLFHYRPRPRQLHLAEAPTCDLVQHDGQEYLVARDESCVRVVSLVNVREEQPA